MMENRKTCQGLENDFVKKLFSFLIRDCSTFRGLDENYVRVAIKTRKENQKLINALEGM